MCSTLIIKKMLKIKNRKLIKYIPDPGETEDRKSVV